MIMYISETLNQGPLAVLLLRQYEFPLGINIVQFFNFFQFQNVCITACTNKYLNFNQRHMKMFVEHQNLRNQASLEDAQKQAEAATVANQDQAALLGQGEATITNPDQTAILGQAEVTTPSLETPVESNLAGALETNNISGHSNSKSEGTMVESASSWMFWVQFWMLFEKKSAYL